MAISADPNSETMQLGWRNELRVTVGMPIPIYRGERYWVTLGGAIEVHDPGGSAFPYLYWRGLLRASFERRWGHTLLGAHYAHESDHESVSTVGFTERLTSPFLYLNSLGVHARHRIVFTKAWFEFGGAARFHGYVITEVRAAIRVGAAFTTSHGDWAVFADTLFGNEVGMNRGERSATAGFGVRYTPPFAD